MDTKDVTSREAVETDEPVNLRSKVKRLPFLRQSVSSGIPSAAAETDKSPPSKASEEHIYENFKLPPKPQTAPPPIPTVCTRNKSASKTFEAPKNGAAPLPMMTRSMIVSSPIESFNAYETEVPVKRSETCVSNTWQRLTDANGETYFTHPQSKDRWVPAESADGRPYYYEQNSRMSLWELPPTVNPTENIADDAQVSSKPSILSPTTIETIDLTKAREKFGANVSKSNKLRRSTGDLLDTPPEERRTGCYRISTDHITGPLENKLRSTERRGMVQRTKYSVDGVRVPKKWISSEMVVSGPNIYFYKESKTPPSKFTRFISSVSTLDADNESPLFKPPTQNNKAEFEFKVTDIKILPADESYTSRGNVFIMVVSSKPDSVVEYLVQTPSSELRKAWETAIRYSQEWTDQRRFDICAFSTRPPPSVDSKIINTLRDFFRKRPTMDAVRASGILPNEPVFGSNLNYVCEQEHSDVPTFVVRVIHAIEARGLDHKGIYRISGNASVIQKLRHKINQSSDYTLNSDEWSIFDLTDTLKQFLRELKEPLFCSCLYDELSEFSTAFKNFTEAQNIASIWKILKKLPPHHLATIKMLFEHLKKVAAKSDLNNMASTNLSIVFGPNLMWPENTDSPLAAYANVGFHVVEFIISNYDNIFVQTPT